MSLTKMGGRPRKVISSPHDPVYREFLGLFGLSSWDDTTSWTQNNLIEKNSVHSYFELRPQLLALSFPRNDIRKIRIEDINMFGTKDLITVLSQFARLYGYCITSYTKDIKPNKTNGLIRKKCEQVYNLSKMGSIVSE